MGTATYPAVSLKRADVKVGFTCNNQCIHCVVGDRRGKFRDKTFQELCDELREAKSKNYEEVVLTGGEPSIRKDICELLQFAKEQGFERIQMQTNGRMLSSKDFCEKVVQAGANVFVLAVHGYTPEQHDYITKGKGNFAQTVKGIKNLKNLEQWVAINVVVTKSNYRNLPEIARLLVKLNVNQFQFAFVHPLGNAYQNFFSVVPRMTLIEPYVKEGLRIGNEAGVCVMTEAIPYCFMSGYEEYIAEKYIPYTSIFDVESYIEDFGVLRTTDGKKKSENCLTCKYCSVCEGPWREYPEKYGWDEFKPVKT